MRTTIAALVSLSLACCAPQAAALDDGLPDCEDVLSEDWCGTLAPPTCEELLSEQRCAGPEGACRSVLSDGLCDLVFA